MSTSKSSSPTYTTMTLPPTGGASSSTASASSHVSAGLAGANGNGTVGSSRSSPRGNGNGLSAQVHEHNQNHISTHNHNQQPNRSFPRGPASSSSTADYDERERELDAAFEGYGFEGRSLTGNGNGFLHGKAAKLGYLPSHGHHHSHGHGNNNKYQRFSSPASSTHSATSPLVPLSHGSVSGKVGTSPSGNSAKQHQRPLATKKDQRRLTLTKAEARRLKFSGTVMGEMRRSESGDEDAQNRSASWDTHPAGFGRRMSARDKGKGKAREEDGIMDVDMMDVQEIWEGDADGAVKLASGPGRKQGSKKMGGKAKKGKHNHRHDIADGISVSASTQSVDNNSDSSSEHTEEEHSFDMPMAIPLSLAARQTSRQASPSSVQSLTRSNDSRSRRERRIPQPPPHTREEDAMDDAPLPEGMDPKDVEDVFLDDGLQGTETIAEQDKSRERTRQRADWESDDEDDEAILFAALDEMSDTAHSDNAGDDTDDEADSSDVGATSDEDDLMRGFGGRHDSPFGFGDALPLVLMEDWSGNLVFAQPRIGSEEAGEDTGSRSTSKSRSKNGKSKSGSKAGSTMTEETPGIVIDAEAIEDWSENEDEEALASDGGDTTDSLPDEDMPSPPEVIPFSLAAAGLEANNASFGVTTVDEAALARDLGLPLADARSLLEQAMFEEQQQLLRHVVASTLDLPANSEIGSMIGIAAAHSAMSVASSSTSSSKNNLTGESSSASPSGALQTGTSLLSPNPAHSLPLQSTPGPITSSGPPQMGSFLPSSADPKRVAVIDGTGKATPSPFLRRGMPSKAVGKRGSSSSQKKRAVGEPPLSPTNKRQRHSSVPAPVRGQFASMRGSPLRQRANPFDREDTPSDVEDAPPAPINIDDVLDTTALHPFDADYGDVNNLQSRHLRNLRRWDRVPVTTFRQSRTPVISFPNGIGPGVFGGGRALQSEGNAMGLREAFSSPIAGNPTLSIDAARGQAFFGQGMVISPLLGPIEEMSYASRGSPESKAARDRQGGSKNDRSRKGNKLRTASMGDMPALLLG